jgi:hypothetical protein
MVEKTRDIGAEILQGLQEIKRGEHRRVVDVPDDALCDAIAQLRAIFPDWRMGQLMANLTTAAGCLDPGAIWDVEDDQLLAAARRFIEQNRGRRGGDQSEIGEPLNKLQG